jgi:outer membrane PBP1 activator LpoA protein
MYQQLKGHLRTPSAMQTVWSFQANLVSYKRRNLTDKTWKLLRKHFYPTLIKGRADEKNLTLSPNTSTTDA